MTGWADYELVLGSFLPGDVHARPPPPAYAMAAKTYLPAFSPVSIAVPAGQFVHATYCLHHVAYEKLSTIQASCACCYAIPSSRRV